MSPDISDLTEGHTEKIVPLVEEEAIGKDPVQQLYDCIRSDQPFETKAREAVELGRAYLGADNGHLAEIDPETDHWKAIVSTDGEDGTVPPGLELDYNKTYCRRTVTEDAPVVLHHASEQGWENDSAFETHGYECYYGTRLVVDGKPFGTVCFVSSDPRTEPYSEDERIFIELLARLLERELERAKHENQLMRQTNLAIVLNRVLRHNLRNDLAVIRGYTQLMADNLEDDVHSKRALGNIDKLIELSQKARELDQVVAEDFEKQSIGIVEKIEEIAANISETYPSADISVEADESITMGVFPSFDRAVWELIDNAAKHAGSQPTVTVSIRYVSNAVEIRVADDGPGINEQEIAVLDTGTETPLAHGSGLGLWLVHWIVASHDGEIEVQNTDRGSAITLTFHLNPATEYQSELQELSRARDQYLAAFEEGMDGMLIIDDEARILHANAAAGWIYGLEADKLMGRELSDFLPTDFDFETAWAEFQAEGQKRDQITIAGADGVNHPIEYSATADIIPGQHLIILRDITEQLRREHELERCKRAMDAAPIGITITDPLRDDNPIIYANKRFEELTGYTEEAIIGRNCRFLQGPETKPEKIEQIRQGIDSKERVQAELLNYQQDGTRFRNHLTLAPVYDEDGQLTNYVGFQEPIEDELC